MSSPNTAVKIALAAICLMLSAGARADSVIITLDPNFGSPDYAFYSYTDTAGAVQNNIPVGPYMATLNGGGYNNMPILVFCYDMNAETNVGTPYSGSIVPFAQLTAPTSTEVLESTYLINELMGDGGLNAPLATRGAISLAIWEIMNPTSTTKSTPFPTDPAALTYESQAVAAVANNTWTAADTNQYPTWMPDNIASIQRFGVVTQTPEPATWVLTGIGLIGFGLVGVRSRGFSLNSVRR